MAAGPSRDKWANRLRRWLPGKLAYWITRQKNIRLRHLFFTKALSLTLPLGPLERLFILGLGLAGNLTAAAIVVAAKGLLRFPELLEERFHLDVDLSPGKLAQLAVQQLGCLSR